MVLNFFIFLLGTPATMNSTLTSTSKLKLMENWTSSAKVAPRVLNKVMSTLTSSAKLATHVLLGLCQNLENWPSSAKDVQQVLDKFISILTSTSKLELIGKLNFKFKSCTTSFEQVYEHIDFKCKACNTCSF